MRERIAKLEGEISGIVRAQTVFTWSVGLMVAVLVGGFAFLGVNTNWRFGRIEREIDEARSEVRAVGAAVSGVAAKLDQLGRPQAPAVPAPAPAPTTPPPPASP